MTKRSIRLSDISKYPGVQVLVTNWITHEKLGKLLVVGIEETPDPYFHWITYVQPGWDGKPVFDDAGKPHLTREQYPVRHSFPWDRLELLRRVASDEMLPGVNAKRAVTRILNGGNPFKEQR